ncbi:MAG: hypothetical protein QM750_05820 [Rubrivivax sp.]
MRRSHPCLILALALGACGDKPPPAAAEAVSAAPEPAPAPAATATARTQQAAIVDAQGFGQPMNAATLEIPAGWQAEGGVSWQRGNPCVSNQLRIAWVARSPDGQQAFEVMHSFSWQLQGRSVPMNPCPVLPFASTRDFLQAVVQQRRQGAQILGYRERPDLRAQAESQAAAPAPGVQRRIDAGELLIAYPFNGGQVHERLLTSVTFTEVQGTVMGGAGVTFAQRRMDREPDPALGDRIVRSMKADPQWLALMGAAGQRAAEQHASQQRQQIERWHAGEMARINAQGMADRAAIRAQTARDVAGIQAQTHANTQATNDRMHRRNLEGIGEYNTYRDTSGNPVQSSIHGGSRVFQHPDGSFSSTNDPYARPPGATELKRVP